MREYSNSHRTRGLVLVAPTPELQNANNHHHHLQVGQQAQLGGVRHLRTKVG